VGREAELARATASIGASQHGVGGVLLVGQSGIGKTTLARAALDEMASVGYEVQWLMATAAGPSIPFGAFAPLVPDMGGRPATRPDLFHTMQDVRRAVIARAGGRPLVLAADDADRLDEASATLVFQLVSTGSASLVAATRTGCSVPGAMRDLWKEGLIDRIDLRPLDEANTIELATLFLGGQVDGHLAGVLWDLSGGNPLYLRELIWFGSEAGRIVNERGLWCLDGELSMGPRLTELVQERLTRLTRSELNTLEIVAFAEPLPMSVLAQLAPSSYICSLQRQGLLTVQVSHGDEQVRTWHPVYGEVLREGLPSPRLVELRTDLAAAFEAADRLGPDLLRVVTWRLDAGGEEDPDLLLAASHRAAGRHDWKLTVRLAEAALDSGKADDAALIMADALNHLGRPQDALDVLGDRQGDEDDEITRVALLRAYTLYWGLGRMEEADAVLARAESRVADVSNRTWMAATRAGMLIFRGLPAQAAADLRPLLSRKDLAPEVATSTRTAMALALAWSGHPEEAVSIIDECDGLRGDGPDQARYAVRWSATSRLAAYRMAGRIPEMEKLAQTEYRRALELRNREKQGGAAGSLGWVALARGQLGSAIKYFRESTAVLENSYFPAVRRQSLAGLTEALALVGDAEGAEEALAQVGGDPIESVVWISPRFTVSSAWVAVAKGELTRAVELFLSAAEVARTNGQAAFEILALHSAARLGEAQVADRLAEMATWVEGPLVQAASTFATAIATADGDALDAAAQQWEGLTMWLHAAESFAHASRAHTLAGSPRRAAASAARAQAILDTRDGPRPIAVNLTLATPTLTRREQEVARLAQTGLSSQAIAERLFLSVRTVDSHLARTYHKLGIAGRRQLAAVLDGRPPATSAAS
jgi:DNA-binding CsgD family transcriptional regulator